MAGQDHETDAIRDQVSARIGVQGLAGPILNDSVLP